MAFQRFANLTEDDIDAFQENAINKNTKSSTKYWMSVVKAWTDERNYLPDISIYAPDDLNELLKKFYSEVKKAER